MSDTIKFTEESIKEYLDDNIKFWRSKQNIKIMTPKEVELKQMAPCYIDAYQSVRISLFGELLPK